MVSALRAGTYLVVLLMALSLLLLLAGLGMAARPESFAGLGLTETAKAGMAIALVGGVGAIASALLSWVLKLLRGTLADQDDSS
ncbi:MAG: hypothetical protein M1380_10315 [Chloroflexi bacterium]|nr:hypothetical protein [Chloroflexota bacterium]